MPRSGTSLTEQILASHPMIKGAGEVDNWNRVIQKRLDEVAAGLLEFIDAQAAGG